MDLMKAIPKKVRALSGNWQQGQGFRMYNMHVLKCLKFVFNGFVLCI